MSISKVRGILYNTAKLLGDISAFSSANPSKISQRVVRRAEGRMASQAMSKVNNQLFNKKG
jgi:hypothetical protein